MSLAAFAIIRVAPGDPVVALLGEQASPERIAQLRRQLHLDGSLVQQYAAFLSDLSRADLGRSISTSQPVLTTISQVLPVTLWIACGSMVVAILIAVPLGLTAAISTSRLYRESFRILASAVIATPVFVSALILLLIFAVTLEILPAGGYRAFPENIPYLILPWLAAGIPNGMVFARIFEQSVRETNKEEFAEAGLVWGLSRGEYLWSFLIRPSIAPTLGLMAYVFGATLAAAVVLEAVFSLPGVGTFLVRGVLTRDYPVVQGTVFVFGIIVVVARFVFDSVAAFLDPRIGASS